MFVFPTRTQVKKINEQQIKSNRIGYLNGTFELPPNTFTSENAFGGKSSADGNFSVTGSIDSPEALFDLGLHIPNVGNAGTVRVSTNPYDKTTVYAVYLAVQDGGVKFHIGRSGFVKYTYDPQEKSLVVDFDFMDVLGFNFKGNSKVYDESIPPVD